MILVFSNIRFWQYCEAQMNMFMYSRYIVLIALNAH